MDGREVRGADRFGGRGGSRSGSLRDGGSRWDTWGRNEGCDRGCCGLGDSRIDIGVLRGRCSSRIIRSRLDRRLSKAVDHRWCHGNRRRRHNRDGFCNGCDGRRWRWISHGRGRRDRRRGRRRRYWCWRSGGRIRGSRRGRDGQRRDRHGRSRHGRCRDGGCRGGRCRGGRCRNGGRRHRGRRHRRRGFDRSADNRSGHRDRSRCGRSGTSRGRHEDGRSGHTHGQEAHRVEIPLRVGGKPNTKVDVGAVDFRIARWAECPDAVACCDRRALCHGDRAEVDERHGIAVGREDCDALTVRRHRSGECHAPGYRSLNRTSRRPTDIDTPMLPGRIRMRRVERERRKHDTINGPHPR